MQVEDTRQFESARELKRERTARHLNHEADQEGRNSRHAKKHFNHFGLRRRPRRSTPDGDDRRERDSRAFARKARAGHRSDARRHRRPRRRQTLPLLIGKPHKAPAGRHQETAARPRKYRPSAQSLKPQPGGPFPSPVIAPRTREANPQIERYWGMSPSDRLFRITYLSLPFRGLPLVFQSFQLTLISASGSNNRSPFVRLLSQGKARFLKNTEHWR